MYWKMCIPIALGVKPTKKIGKPKNCQYRFQIKDSASIIEKRLIGWSWGLNDKPKQKENTPG